MRSSPSSSSSSCSLASTSLTNRLETVFKKAYELTTLCDIEACVIHYGPDGELKTWPEDRDKVRDMTLRYSQLDEAKRRKKSVNLSGFLMKKKKNVKTNLKKKAKTNDLKYPISDHYSPDQISQLIESLEQSYSTLKERLRFLEAQKQKKETKLEDLQSQSLAPPTFQTQSLNPSKFSLFMYNAGDATLSQIPLSALKFNQVPSQFTNYSAVQESGLKNQLMHQEPYGYDQNNMCMSGITKSNNFQHLCVSHSQDLSALPSELPESVNNFGLNQLMQQEELYGFDQIMCTSDTTNNNVLDPCLLKTVSDDFCSEFQVGNTSFHQDFPDVSTSYDVQSAESSLLQRSTLPSLYTVPNSYFLSENSRFL